MQTASTQIITDAPSALSVIYLPNLPAVDRRPNVASYAVPLAYYPATPPFPGNTVVVPTSPAEIYNFDGVTEITQPGSSGTTSIQFVDYTTLYAPAMSGATSGTILGLDSNSNFNTFQPSQSIILAAVEADAADTWYVRLQNGLVYRDTTLNAEDTTSWLWNIPGISSGSALRLFYTLPSPALWFNYDDSGVRSISSDGNFDLVSVQNAQAYHETKGDIFFDAVEIHSLESLVEISNQQQSIIYNGPSLTGIYDSPSFKITYWDGIGGKIRIKPAPTEGSMLVTNYTKENLFIDYRGFFDENTGLWQSLDLNPTSGRTYNTGADGPSTNGRVPRQTETLLHLPVVLYLLPTAAILLDQTGNPVLPIKYYSAYKEGGKNGHWYPLRHYVPSTPPGSSQSTPTVTAASWGFATLDIATYPTAVGYSAAERGIPFNQDSALLVAQIRLNPKPQTELDDARRFSGLPGTYDRKSFTTDGTDPRANRWDLSPWEGLAAPINATVLVEASSGLISDLGINTIQDVVQKNLPPGVISIVRPSS